VMGRRCPARRPGGHRGAPRGPSEVTNLHQPMISQRLRVCLRGALPPGPWTQRASSRVAMGFPRC
jgi:hypothetical protein